MPEAETFWTLLHDPAHWQFEIFLMIIFDLFVGALLWPRVRKWLHIHAKEDAKIAELEKRITQLEKR